MIVIAILLINIIVQHVTIYNTV